jgi:hypothetical protein
MAVSGDQWPVFLYHGYSYDPEDPWNGLFQSTILISVRTSPLRYPIYNDMHCLSGIQAHIHVSQFGQERAKGYTIRQHAHTWHDLSDHAFNRLRSHPGQSWSYLFKHTVVFIDCDSFRFDLHWLHPPFFPEPTQWRILRDSTTLFWIYLKMLKNKKRWTISRRGGIGMVLHQSLFVVINSKEQPDDSQIFPNYSSARRSVCKNSTLARIKEKRAELKAAANA